MSMKTVSTIVIGDQPDAMEAAIACASTWSAHLDVVCLSGSQFEVPMIFSPDVALGYEAILNTARSDLEEIEERVLERLRGETVTSRVDASVRSDGNLRASLTEACRYSDLVVLPSPDDSAVMKSVLEQILYSSRVPLLVVPDDAAISFDTILLAWDESEVALAAIRAALPLLRDAGTVEIVMVESKGATEGRDVAVMLERQGVKAPLNVLPLSGRSVSDVLQGRAQEIGADLIVMGAYGHRRLREVLLGGVTRSMMERPDRPLLLAR
ncbi:nucleotide-binding universal stress UspA family protein [Palleronia aestuarii]|uniref:Nucleotide-binding universal stress UspA family protein n=1 Tax=Palleronia aestuarii TaxID=568105 RepID=A0A2W7MTP9_9RHOB|nr:universal stress protein [Palleronia aestuarii]PZX10901.1 nucleotide-binding universal stress UspA family protein [Palleronia aestuarii]